MSKKRAERLQRRRKGKFNKLQKVLFDETKIEADQTLEIKGRSPKAFRLDSLAIFGKNQLSFTIISLRVGEEEQFFSESIPAFLFPMAGRGVEMKNSVCGPLVDITIKVRNIGSVCEVFSAGVIGERVSP